MITILRSVAFNVSFYLNTAIFLVIALPTFLMPYQAVVEVANTWGRVNLVLLRVIAGVDVEIRGRDKIPP
ncbi:MAG TPA: 1-acyl-sn-glycerol-3-phosphate acyltransferase, partial [Pseudolabrys sp.]